MVPALSGAREMYHVVTEDNAHGMAAYTAVPTEDVSGVATGRSVRRVGARADDSGKPDVES